MINECHCVICGECNGAGFHRVEDHSLPDYELETCDECRGSGMSEICENCAPEWTECY